jgi:dTDP-4-dehydrorhamnose reductase
VTTLVTGGSGVLGHALALTFPEADRPSKRELDITDEHSVRAYCSAQRPSAIVHAAALTDIGKCEANREAAWRTNVEGTENLLQHALAVAPDCFFIYISTAGVFRGDTGNYSEESRPDPVNYYGVTKFRAEQVVGKHSASCVIRTNFVRRGKWPHPYAFSDRFGTFLYDTGAAKGIREVFDAHVRGLVHVCGDQRLSLFEVARRTDSDVKPTTMNRYTGPPLAVDMSMTTRRWSPYSLED